MIVRDINLYTANKWVNEVSKIFIKKMYQKIYTEEREGDTEVPFSENFAKNHILGLLFGKEIKNLVDMLSMTISNKNLTSAGEEGDLTAELNIIDDILVEFKDILKLQL